MKRILFTLLAATFVALAPAIVHAGAADQEWILEDEPVPLDRNYVQYRLLLDVDGPTACNAFIRSDFFNVEEIGNPTAAVAVFEISGVESSSVCTVDTEAGDKCVAINQMEFEAEGKYEILFTVGSFPAGGLGDHWDDFGSDGQQPLEPGSFHSGLHHSTTLTQDCGEVTTWEVVRAK